MHNCAIIIKPKELSIREARKIVGDDLVTRGTADWYSENDYRERHFGDGKKEISLKDFKIDNYILVVAYIKENYIDKIYIPYEFYEFYNSKFIEQLKNLVNEYTKLYQLITSDLIETLLKENKDYTVCLLDYHC